VGGWVGGGDRGTWGRGMQPTPMRRLPLSPIPTRPHFHIHPSPGRDEARCAANTAKRGAKDIHLGHVELQLQQLLRVSPLHVGDVQVLGGEHGENTEVGRAGRPEVGLVLGLVHGSGPYDEHTLQGLLARTRHRERKGVRGVPPNTAGKGRVR
jgi:hypothetical protein